ncbi:hydroxymethylglutaryl-CoA reductase [Aliiglaciecola litoralis]|uniref:hydroxymethylglutaryl-CoA reductase (NADPH) n=1 Tax=Aliiglaciecola litoralis TaxID=582857 RepID=A0ABN1LRE5_9ALTE
MFVPDLMVKQIYTIGSLRKSGDGFVFKLKNRLKESSLRRIISLSINNQSISPEKISISTAELDNITPAELQNSDGITISLGAEVIISIDDFDLAPNDTHHISMRMEFKPLGEIHLKVKDAIKQTTTLERELPRNAKNDLEPNIIKQRQDMVRDFCKSSPGTLFDYTLKTQSIKGNIEHFVGAAQVPVGIAGPLTVNGEHAKGQYLIPMATTEGTLVASYNRGMKLLNRNGGVTATVVEDLMQRAPVFVFNDARQARDFAMWIDQHFEQIKQQADDTDPHVSLIYIDTMLSNKFAYLRFNFSTGDAAGQNMVGRATFVACSWVLAQYKGVANFFLESNIATDKKSSQINIMRTRGKRVTAEATIKRDDLRNLMRVEPEQIDFHARVSAVGSFLAGTTNTGLHSANGIAAMFIATGQDVANVAESSAAILYSEVDKNGDLYLSVTIPALIVATCGGGTGLSTQRECLDMLDCVGADKARKLAEIIASVVLAGEISLACAISSLDWVPSHEEYGRN